MKRRSFLPGVAPGIVSGILPGIAPLSLLSALLVLAGCAANVAQPPASTLQTPAAWRSSAASDVGPNAGPNAGPVAREWWQSFGDPALTALVAKALGKQWRPAYRPCARGAVPRTGWRIGCRPKGQRHR
jgi:hypothetical protein